MRRPTACRCTATPTWSCCCGCAPIRIARPGGTVPGERRARAEPCSIALGPWPAFAPLPALELSATLGSAAEPLVDLANDPNLPLDPLKVQAVRIGFALDGQHRP